MNKQINLQTNKRMNKATNEWINKQSNKETNKKTDKRINKAEIIGPAQLNPLETSETSTSYWFSYVQDSW